MLFCSDNSFFLYPDVNVPVSHTLFPWFLYHPPCFHTWEGAAPDTHTNWREAESSPAERNLGVVGGGDNTRNGMELYHGAVMDCVRGRSEWVLGKGFSPDGDWAWSRLPRLPVVMSPSCQTVLLAMRFEFEVLLYGGGHWKQQSLWISSSLGYFMILCFFGCMVKATRWLQYCGFWRRAFLLVTQARQMFHSLTKNDALSPKVGTE